tara:strand:- start:291 stop:656 length:366 start_codon:yes stop_codon:yes gene_type:complete
MRNDTIFKYQNNRNPFVDHPSFVQSIYGARYGSVSVGSKEPNEINTYKIYPNPSNKNIIVESNKRSIVEVLVIDSQGRLVLKEQPLLSRVDINVDELKRGLYFVRIIDSEGQEYTHRHIIE